MIPRFLAGILHSDRNSGAVVHEASILGVLGNHGFPHRLVVETAERLEGEHVHTEIGTKLFHFLDLPFILSGDQHAEIDPGQR